MNKIFSDSWTRTFRWKQNSTLIYVAGRYIWERFFIQNLWVQTVEAPLNSGRSKTSALCTPAQGKPQITQKLLRFTRHKSECLNTKKTWRWCLLTTRNWAVLCDMHKETQSEKLIHLEEHTSLIILIILLERTSTSFTFWWGNQTTGTIQNEWTTDGGRKLFF